MNTGQVKAWTLIAKEQGLAFVQSVERIPRLAFVDTYCCLTPVKPVY